jgi:formylglycine-generating enzyme required for sulfatase activity
MNVATVLAQLSDDLVDIPTGEVTVGSDLDTIAAVLSAPDLSGVEPAWLRKELPRHVVSVPAFRIGRLPMTIAPGAGTNARDIDCAGPGRWPRASRDRRG